MPGSRATASRTPSRPCVAGQQAGHRRGSQPHHRQQQSSGTPRGAGQRAALGRHLAHAAARAALAANRRQRRRINAGRHAIQNRAATEVTCANPERRNQRRPVAARHPRRRSARAGTSAELQNATEQRADHRHGHPQRHRLGRMADPRMTRERRYRADHGNFPPLGARARVLAGPVTVARTAFPARWTRPAGRADRQPINYHHTQPGFCCRRGSTAGSLYSTARPVGNARPLWQTSANTAKNSHRQRDRGPRSGSDPQSASGLAAIGDFFSRLTQANTWIRAAEVILGVVLLGIGIARITDAVPAATKIAKTAGAVALA